SAERGECGCPSPRIVGERAKLGSIWSDSGSEPFFAGYSGSEPFFRLRWRGSGRRGEKRGLPPNSQRQRAPTPNSPTTSARRNRQHLADTDHIRLQAVRPLERRQADVIALGDRRQRVAARDHMLDRRDDALAGV